MRIAGLSIDGFGIFRDVDLRDLPPGLSLFLGDNEAGKSTTLAFVHTVLFGYPDGRSRENEYPPLRGGRPGGRLLLATESDGDLTVERREGKKGGPVTVTFPDGRSEGRPALARLLGGTTRPLYRTLYAFSLHELERLDSLTDEAVRDVIYGASLGAGSRSFPQVRRHLEDRLGALFKPSGSRPEINALLKELEGVRDRLRDARKGLDEFQELAKTLTELDARIRRAREELRAGREEHERRRAHLQAWDDWTAMLEATSRLGDLPEKVESFPEDGLSRLDKLAGRIEHEEEELRRAEEDLREKKEKLQRLELDEALLARGAEIRALVRGLGTYEQAVTEIPRAEERLAGARRQAEEVLAEFGAGWTEERVLELDRSSMVRGRIEEHREAMAAARRQAEKASDAVAGLRDQREEALREDKAAREKVEWLESRQTEVPSETLVALKERRTQFQDVLRDLPRVEIQREKAGEELHGLLRDISPAWTPETLERFDTSMTARQKVTEVDTRLAGAEASRREAAGDLQRAEARLAETEGAVEAKAKQIEATSGEEESAESLRERKGWIRSLREGLHRRDAIRSELRLRQETARPGAAGIPAWLGRRVQALAGAVAAFGVLAGAILWVAAGPGMGGVAGGALLLAAGILFVLGRWASRAAGAPSQPAPGADDAAVRRLREELQAAEASIQELKTKLGLMEEVTAPGVDALEDDNAGRIRAAEDRERLRRELEELHALRDRAEKERKAAAAAVEEATRQLEAEQEAWRNLAESLDLTADTSPRTAGLVFAKAETARQQVRRIAEFDHRLAAMRRARDEYLDLMAQVPDLAATARDGGDEERLAALAAFLSEMDRQEEQRRLLADARQAAERAARALEAVTEKLQAAVAGHERAAAAEEETGSAWTGWLEGQGMETSWSPESCLRLLDHAGRLADFANGRDEAAGTVERLTASKEEFEERLARLCSELGRSRPPADKIVAEVHALESVLEEHSKRQTLHEELAGEIPDLESRGVRRRSSLEERKTELRDLLSKGGAGDEETFRTRGRLYEERRQLERAIADHEGRVRKLTGEADLEVLRRLLEGATLPSLRAAEKEAGDRVAEAEAGLDELQGERARMDERRRQLLDEDAVARLRAREESLLERFRELAADWGRHAVALHLLTTAKDRFEKAHQPEVIQHASRSFSRITGGRYEKVFAPHGEETIEVIEADGSRKGVDALSRGTAEQLYLAIRFGYIASQDASRERLPILMDDVLVNFDPTRASQAAEGILEMAASHQVLFFTCHPEMVDIFRRHRAEVPVYRLEDRDIAGPVAWRSPSRKVPPLHAPGAPRLEPPAGH